MHTIRIDPCVMQVTAIQIGKQAENDACEIVFDLSALIDTYGDGSATLVHQRQPDVAPYAITAVQDDVAKTLTWTVSNTDTAYEGYGQAEIRWMVNDVLAKTFVLKTYCRKSITGDIVIPAVLQSWYDAMLAYVDDVASGMFEFTDPDQDGNIVVEQNTQVSNSSTDNGGQ